MRTSEAARSVGAMGKLRERMRAMLHWPSKKTTPTPSERKQEDRWEGEGGALHPQDEHDDA
ncbi:hypothetical protein GCM10025864_37940 [Luteimicrobium album]|uniref:Uncharacterized protein n=1 Tax=Luteimicrobium album TaxID=1054550 RepID=A0ABQ6I5J8_9MICO|nr:hypothetical protein GCM10025864_37940 [Luteimicrobium album]